MGLRSGVSLGTPVFSRLLAAIYGPKSGDRKTQAPEVAAVAVPPAPMTKARADRLFDAGEHAAARAAYEQLIGTAATPGLLVNRGYCELALGEIDTAQLSFQAALSHSPQFAPAWVGLGDAAAQKNRHAEALRCYDSALDLNGALLIARNNRAQSLLALGRMEEAWRENETRLALPNAATLYPHRPALPRWDGTDGKRVLVHWEQGFGDIIQHLRFLPAMAAHSRGCVFECPPPLLALMRRMPGAPALIEAGNQPPQTADFDCHAPLLSLPFLLGMSAKTLPHSPYLAADAARVTALRAGWKADGKHLVGIAWRASTFDPRRSLALAQLLEAFTLLAGSVRLVSLQKDISADEGALLLQHGGIEAGSGFGSFDDTATALAALDTIVCVDTAVAHLAGALARTTLLLLNEPAAVRWMLDRNDSPWYPSVRLLRKGGDTPWPQLLDKAAQMLAPPQQPPAGRA